MRTSARNVALLLFDEVELLDFSAVLQVLSLAGRQWNWRPFKVHAVSSGKSSIETRSQLRVETTATLASCPKPEIVIVPGGYGARRILDDEQWLRWLGEAGPSAEHLAAIGAGSLLLAKAGLLGSELVAATPELARELAELSPDARVTRERPLAESGRLLTAATSGAALDLGLLLVQRCLGEKQAHAVAGQLGHVWSGGSGPLRIEIVDPE